MCTCAETCGTTGSRELCSLYHDLRLAALRRNTQCTSCAVFFVACTVQVVVIAHAFDMVHAGDTVHAVDTEPLRLCPEMRR